MVIGDRDIDVTKMMSREMRKYFVTEDEETVVQMSREKALFHWREKTQFCGRCGAKLVDHDTLTARRCPQCGNLIFPRIEPCIICLVHNAEGKILLANHVQRPGFYACIAGFIEAGESAEHAVRREILEETGLKVKNITYFGTQSWPFPSQFMIAFTAEYESGEITLQKEELLDAQWFDPHHLPDSPKPGSIAYRMIQAARNNN